MESELLSLPFPKGLLDYFKVTNNKKVSEKIHIYLKEKWVKNKTCVKRKNKE